MNNQILEAGLKVAEPVGEKLGESAGVMEVFVGSVPLHEIAITLPVRAGFGLPTSYFTLHGLQTVAGKKARATDR